LLNTYKYGWKTSYYQNTYDYKTDDSVEMEEESSNPIGLNSDSEIDEATCDACAI